MGGSKQQTPNLIGIRVEPLQSRIGASKYIKSDWTMEAFVLPRSSLGLTFADKELQYNSIYFLFGYDGPTEKVYVGQAKKRNSGGSVLLRLQEHDKSITEPYRDIWQYAIVITSINDDWGPTELNNLEHLFYQEIPAKNNLNGNNPNFGGIDQDTDYSEKIRQAKAYIKAIGLQIFHDTEETEKIQVESVIKDYSTVEDLQNGMARIPEIITPHKVVKSMIDMLPKELFNPDTTFLDLACKGGEYLRELYVRLMETESLIAKYPDEFERSNHILGKQLFGIALSQVSLDRTEKSLKGYSHNIKVIPSYISYIKDKKDETGQFKTMINRELGRMKFDVIIGNPPYQESTGGGSRAVPIYQQFVNNGFKLANIVCMITPARWFSADDSASKEMRKHILCKKTSNIVYYKKSETLFNGISINGGVSYFVTNNNYYGETTININGAEICKEYIEDNTIFIPIKAYRMLVLRIIKEKKFIDCTFFSQNAFGLDTNFYKTGCSLDTDIWVKTSAGVFEASTNELVKGIDILNKYKIITGSMNTTSVINKAEVLNHGMACTRTYTVLGVCSDLELANRLAKYMQTKFVRALIAATLNNQMVSKENYRFVPMQDFTQSSDIDWTKSISDIDKQLYKKYNLTQEEIDYIESTIKPMN